MTLRNRIQRRTPCVALLCWWVIGCSSVDELSRVCLPTADCAAIDTIETPANCSTCLSCNDNWGACDPEGSACKRGKLDLDPSAPGCEATTSEARGQFLLHSTGDPLSFFSFNNGRFVVPIHATTVALDQDDPSCVPTLTTSCAYTVRAVQLEIADFTIPESSWSGGVATLTGPVGAIDNGSGVFVDKPMLFAFDVQEDATRRVALTPASAQLGILKDPHSATIRLRVDSIDFGGYKITDLFLEDELTSE